MGDVGQKRDFNTPSGRSKIAQDMYFLEFSAASRQTMGYGGHRRRITRHKTTINLEIVYWYAYG